MSVYVLDRSGRPLMPCSEKRARKLLNCGRARVHRLQPFVIRLVDRTQDDCTLQHLRLKLDPGSKATGAALVRESESTDATGEVRRAATVVNLMEIIHRGRQISEALTARRQMRRRRRGNLRYRAPRFLNRCGVKTGWLAPSLQHRVDTTMAWVKRLQRWAPIKSISSELVCFDMQALQNPEISGMEYQQGTLHGYEIREYLLEKWGRACAYCGTKDVPLQIEHIQAKARSGSNRPSNLTLACQCCNQKKGSRPIEEYLAKDPKRLAHILAYAKRPLKDAAAVNATRWALADALKATGVPLELSSGGRTKFNRSMLSVPKTHSLDAACVGLVDAISGWVKPVLTVKCTGRGSYQRTRLDKFGFPRGYLMRSKRVHGFGTGDMVIAKVPKGVKAGVHAGRVAVRASGSFNVQTHRDGIAAVFQGINHRHCRVVQRNDGYGYFLNRAISKT
ncbi:RNA-guided endonuclease IscB [Variovorax sp. JS1663]|uniref:RNA-guided endonuclease IscB n=1 Tax=Variovorax sp. JS1663 TaxID=1851577 RepID=UPI000B349AD7|nr:RNA-guided endonuclease IscB [Variovorax sp. JS1663]OUM00708.1 HNH endonuclease [Variovorax sp. JS1663]